MSIKTGRAEGTAEILIDWEQCTHCGLCARVCSGGPLLMIRGQLTVDQDRLFGCIACGHCMCVCPLYCIGIRGRDMHPDDAIPVSGKNRRAGYDQLYSLLLSRRSVRNFREREVEPDITRKIIDAVATAPMGLPPSDVEILVFDSRAKVREFAGDILEMMKSSRWLFSPVTSMVMRPFAGKEYFESTETFIRPAIKFFLEEWAQGADYLLYDAPLAMYFHSSPYADPADSLVAATYAMLGAESLGLGSCMIGTPAYFIKYSKKIKRKYGLPPKNQPGIVVVFGYSSIKFSRSLKRRVAGVTYA